jgi:hypothetical protein
MANKSLLSILILPAILLLVTACTGLQSSSTLPAKHPTAEEIGAQPKICTDCHDSKGGVVDFKRFVHTLDWGKSHKVAAYQAEAVCAICHEESYCNDCHASRVELKPSDKNATDPTRDMPHRGDYLTRHRIDGRIDPTSCFRCHGNPKASRTCAPCHG